MLLTAEGARRAADGHDDGARRLHGLRARAAGRGSASDVVDFVAKSGTFYTPTLLVAYGGPWGEQYYWQTHNAHDDAKLNRFVPHDVIDREGAALSRGSGRRSTTSRPSPTGAAEVLRAGGNVSLGAHGQLQGLGPALGDLGDGRRGRAREGLPP